MDVDVSMTSEEEYTHFFDLSPTHFAWLAPRPQEIEVRRAHMSDVLIFDILLTSGGIRQPHTLYPPSDPASLQRLLHAIANSTFDTLKQDCLIYFLLKWHQDGREEEFMLKRCIPPQFAALSDAYWHLDSGINVARAVSVLSDARLNRDYTSKVLQALSLSEDPHTLIRTFVRTARPLITEPDDIDAYTIALAESSLLEAWTYQRSFCESSDTRIRLLRKLIDWCLTPKPRLAPLTHLLAFPWSPYEQSLIHSYSLDPPSRLPPSSVSVIQDLVCVRLVQSGQHATAIKLDRQFASSPRSEERAHERRQMMDELISAMPTAERLLLELELEQFAQGHGMADVKGKGKEADTSMSMSWEKISSPRSNGAINTTVVPPTPPIPQRSGAPRFGGAVPPAPTIEEMFPSISRIAPSSTSQMPKPPSSGPLLFGGISAQQSSISTNATSNGWKPKSTANGTMNTPTISGSAARPSLFDVAGSANAAPNAFYQPPASASVKRPLFVGFPVSRPEPAPVPVSVFTSLAGKTSPTGSAKPTRSGRKSGGGGVGNTSLGSVKGPLDADISMLSELSDSDSARADDSMAAVSRALGGGASADMDDESAEFSVSLFGRSAGANERRIATDSGARIARSETEARLPPGAFLPDDAAEGEKDDGGDGEKERSVSMGAGRRKGRGSRASGAASARAAPREPSSPLAPSPPPAPKPRPKPKREPEPEPVHTRTPARPRRAVKSKDLGRSIPGSLMDDDDDDDDTDDGGAAKVEEAEEEEDRIAPLPTPARRSARTSSRMSLSNTGQADRPARRSSRLSAVSSVGSSSPEPLSPQKLSAATRLRKSTRASGGGAATAGAASAKVTKTRKRRA